MPKAFSETNIENIRRVLIDKGRDYFIRYGLKKTSIDDLTRAAGIAKGSFYRFFDSKEALFMAIHEETESKLQTDMMQMLENTYRPEEKLRAFFRTAFNYIETDPLLRVILTGTDQIGLTAYMATPDFQAHYQNDITFMEDLIRGWQAQGIIRLLDPVATSNFVASHFYIVMQKEALGEEMYWKVVDMTVESLVAFLSPEKEDKK